ncbi:MAG: peptide ABC transporter permease, partial [Acinetobacter sp.]
MKSLALKTSMALISMLPFVAKAELIVLASPQSDDAYYAEMIDDIFEFHV